MIGPAATVAAQPMYAEERVQKTPSGVESAARQNGAEVPEVLVETTGFAGRIIWFLQTLTPEVSLRVDIGHQTRSPVMEEDEGDRENHERLVFLSRKYANQRFSPEANARLEILTERIRGLIPRVKPADLDTLENIAGDLARIQDSSEALEKELDKLERSE